MKTNNFLSEAWGYSALAIAFFLLLKGAYSFAQIEQLHFLLYPTSRLVATFTGTTDYFLSGEGYYNGPLNILINKSCSGFNFWAISFLMAYSLLKKAGYSRLRNLLAIPIGLLLTYLFTILVNTTRILFSIFIHAEHSPLIAVNASWSHQAEGTFIYLSYLIIAYLSIDYLQTQKTATL